MTHQQRMLNAIRGKPVDQIAWAPRLDLWYNANCRAGTLPAPYRHATLREITDDLGWGYHAIVPQFKDLRAPEDDIHRALGIYNLWMMPCHTVFHDVDITVTRRGDETTVGYSTPRGKIQTCTLHDEAMRAAGITISHITETAVKSAADYPALAHIFANAEVTPNFGGYSEFAGAIGDRGLAAGFLSLAGSPMHLLQRELMPVELFFFECADHPEEMAGCAAAIGGYFDRLFAVAANSPAPLFLFGANYDAGITYPPFFEEHIQPWLQRLARLLHPQDKYLLTHTDGENTGLLEHYLAAEIDIADSICPKPMTRLSLGEVRDVFAGRITIMGGLPSVALFPGSMSDRDFDAFLDDFFVQIGAGDHLILGVSDTTPPQAAFERLIKVGRRIAAFGGKAPSLE